MDIEFAILGLLNWQPLSGYDLKKIIAESELFYWSGNNNQIYNSLVSLHKQGLVTQEVQYQESLPAKKIYTITDQGRAALRGGLDRSPELPEIRSSFLIQLAFAGGLSGAEIDALLARYADEIAVQLRMRQAQANHPPVNPTAGRRERFIWEKVNANLVNAYRHELDWIHKVRQGLAEMNATAE